MIGMRKKCMVKSFYHEEKLVKSIMILSWQHSHFVFFFMIFKASLLIQITNIDQLCIDHFVR